MRINEESVKETEKLIDNLIAVIEAYGITQKRIYTSADMSKNTWRKKIREKTFTIVELKQIVKEINK